MDLNVIFISPLSDFLKELILNLPEGDGFVVYELDSIDEYKQVVEFLPKAITLTSNLKTTQSYLKQVQDVKDQTSHNYFITDRNIPLTLDVKMCADGLNAVLKEASCDFESVKKIILDFFKGDILINESLLSNNITSEVTKKKSRTMRLERGISDISKSKFDFSSRKSFSIRDPELSARKDFSKLDLRAVQFSKKRNESPKEKRDLYHYNLKKIKLDKNITEHERKQKFEDLVNTYIEEFDPPEYTKDILNKNPQKLEELLEDNGDRFLGLSFNLEFLVFVSEFYKYKEPDNESITKFIHLSLKNLVSSETSFYKINENIEILHSYHTDKFIAADDMSMFLEDILETIKELKFEYWADPEFKTKENYYIYPYFYNNKLLAFSLTHFKNDEMNHDAKKQFETFSSLAKGIFI